MSKETLRKILIAIFALIFLVSGGMLIRTLVNYNRDKEFYAKAQSEFVTVADASADSGIDKASPPPGEQTEGPQEPKEASPGISVDFDALKAVNPDVVAWIWLPELEISYPVLRGASNSTYLGTTYTGERSGSGSIFMDYRNSADFSDKNTIIYGHNMNNGSMFGSLKKFQSSYYLYDIPFFCIIDPEGPRTYEICYVLRTDALSSVYTYSFADDASFSAHLDMLERIALHSAAEPSEEDSIVTLSTCTGGARTERFVVVGRLLPTA